MFFNKKINKKSKVINISSLSRKMALDKLLKNKEFSEIFYNENIISIFQILFVLDTSQNFVKLVDAINEKNIKVLKSLRNEIPFDFDSVDYPVLKLFEIESEYSFFCIIAKQSIDYSTLDVKFVLNQSTSIRDSFESYIKIL